jgi:MEMO1 family protein
MSAPVRLPAVAGAFYPEDGAALTREIERCFMDPRGPGELPARHRDPERYIRAAIVPHAGYVYSGPIAALAYHAIARERPPESVLFLGVNHHGRGPAAALSESIWNTPLGPVPPEPTLLSALDRPPLVRDESAHAREHSIEVQLPFLLYVLPHPRCVAISVSFASLDSLELVAGAIRQAIRGRDVLLMASTDFSHYVPEFQARQLDELALKAIETRSARSLYDTVVKHDISMCGIAPTTVALAVLEGEDLKVKRLRWGHSGEVETMARVVGYASLLFESETPLPRSG